ncbi:ABC transporter substrate-binding protein [Facklamia languida]|uniref:ABC transporter substrate-binding protein n=1 Tax=Facklamia languida CCUG 37842 TaxID=883113 RepID=H3NIF3_9LACT|nr:ABC transporter substrate-binding protein [Facklamia languida]EHR37463.1 hypothetical protein HMPREF9708_00642 [Facklamia languida CCUG 37842]
MKKLKEILLLVITAALFISLLPAKLTHAQERETINFWYSLGGRNEELIQNIVKEFNKTQDKYEVVATYQGNYDETVQKLQQAIASNTQPDISMIERAYVQQFAESATLVDLTPYLEQYNINIDDFVPGLLGHSYFNDGLVSLPFNRSTPIMHVNKSMLEENGLEIPKTWEELKEVANALVIKEGDEIQRYGLTMPYDTWFPIAMITQSNGRFFNEDGSAIDFVDNGVGHTVFSFLKDLQSTGALYYPGSSSAEDVVQMFFSGKVGLIYSSTGSIGSFIENLEFDYTTAFLPQNEKISTPTGGANIALLNNGNIEGAMTFIDFLVNDPVAAESFIAESGYLPFTYSIAESDTIQEQWEKEPMRRTAFEQLEYAEDTNKSPKWPEVMHEFFSAIEAIMYDNEDIDQTLEEFKNNSNTILSY